MTADARNLSKAIRSYAQEHEGEVPTSFDQAAAFFYEDQDPPQADGFEIIYQGSLKELTNIPLRAVALIRERQAWATPSGKWARIYVLADGHLTVVESDDDFRTWEEGHVIPAKDANR